MAAPALCLALLVLFAPAELHAQAIQDSRCYLMNGGAVESFFISEDTPVGSIIGTLSVNGDPSEDHGDITLRLQERGAAVGIAPGSKNITLLRALDREEKKGPSNVYVNVRCDRRHTTDPSFVIPVSVRVWDVNDNAPVWAGGPYRARISELAAVGTRVAPELRAHDADQPGPHAAIHYAVLPGPNSEYLGFVNELDSALVVKKPLDYETLRNFTVVLRAQDQGSPALHSDTTLSVLVLDADDQNPRFSHDHYSAVLPTDAKEGTILVTSPGPISAADQDLGINAPLHYSTTGDNKLLVTIDRDSGQITATKELLEQLQPVTIVLKATQVDNADRYALATLGVTLASPASTTAAASASTESSTPVRFKRRQYSAALSEATAPGTALLALDTDPPAVSHARNPLQFYVSDRNFLDKFAINSAGEVILRRPLDYETTSAYHYQVMVTDSLTNDTASINITVLNENEWEPRFRFPQYEFRAEGSRGDGLLKLGRLEAHDGDAGDSVQLALHGPAASMFYVNSDGDMFLREEVLPSLNSSVLHVVATAYDSGSPPKQTSVPVIVHVGEELMGAAGGAGASAGVSAAAGGAGALALLALLAAALCLYLKRAKPASVSHTKTTVYAHEKPRSPASTTLSPVRSATRAVAPAPPAVPAAPAPTPAVAAPSAASSGSLLSVSAGASTILANSSSSLDLRQEALTTSNTNDGVGIGGGGAGAGGGAVGGAGAALMSDHLQAGGAGRSGVAWPSRTIPARLKKLSWDDQGSGSENPVHDATNPTVAEHMNLTVYF
ncbi:hypothetical protein O3G_MSEX003096 [Manduca sexta]|uniref:Cadherin domain-containing protein n=1 Tax=Manduca sexta TaxID=7130 RepID=A0A921YRG0_MANSE|nr:hypothetical protein O3G_MSEX003096 [Manduca sexta]